MRAFKARCAALPPPPPDGEIRAVLDDMAGRLAAASITQWGRKPAGLELGGRPLLVICDDLQSRGVGIADEQTATGLQGTHPLAAAVLARTGCDVLVFEEGAHGERPRGPGQGLGGGQRRARRDLRPYRLLQGRGGLRLPAPQIDMWRQLATSGKLRAMLLFESPYALSDLPEQVPVVVGYGADRFTLQAAAATLLDGKDCPGTLPVTVR